MIRPTLITKTMTISHVYMCNCKVYSNKRDGPSNMKSLAFVLFYLVWCVTALPEEHRYNRYVGYKVLQVVPKSLDDVSMLRDLMLNNNQLDFWHEPAKNLGPVHIMTPPRQLSSLTTKLRKAGMSWTIHKDHLERDIDNFIAKEKQRRAKSKKVFDIDDFNTYDDIMGWLPEQVSICETNDLTCEYFTGENPSVEGRDLPGLTVSSGGNDKPVFYIDATTHAREWLTTATILKIIDHVVNGNGAELLDFVDFVFMPVQNPDGYVHSWDVDRYWRKNRQQINDNCIGVDLNRNFNHNHCMEGVSTSPCSDIYCGPSGNSEPETQSVAAELNRYASAINNGGASISLHSFAHMWLHPWGNTVGFQGDVCERTEDHEELYRVAEITARAIMNTNNNETEWTYGNGCEVIYPTTGSTDDYAKGVAGIKYSYLPELRGDDFAVDADQIQPSFVEVWAGLVAKYGAISTRM